MQSSCRRASFRKGIAVYIGMSGAILQQVFGANGVPGDAGKDSPPAIRKDRSQISSARNCYFSDLVLIKSCKSFVGSNRSLFGWNMKNRQYLWLSFFSLLLSFGAEIAAAQDYFDMSIEQLANIQITSVARKPQKASDAAAAVFVLTGEDIRRSGATTIAEALRLVPGVHVARIDAYRWAVTARGSNDVFANKLLVLMDGRTVYTPLFSGTFWDVQDTMIEDIDRIEVIRGPGASLWGANAVNGVINIITKSSKDTQGGLASAGGGNIEQVFGETRYGDTIGKDTTYRVYAKYADRDGFEWQNKGQFDKSAGYGWQTQRGGFRTDSQVTKDDLVTVQGDIYQVNEGQAIVFDPELAPLMGDFPDETKGSGGNVLSRWNRKFSETSDMQLQTYFDRVNRNDATSIHGASTFDMDYQHRFEIAKNNDFMYGAGYRRYEDNTDRNFGLQFDPEARSLDLYTSFIQDDITLAPDLWHLIVGSKFEHNDYTGFEFEPNIRTTWTPDNTNTVWAAVSRAVRTPSRAERDVRLVAESFPPTPEMPLPTILEGFGNPDFDSEDLYAYELGYRVRPRENLSFDLATFFNHYDNFRSAQPLEAFPEFEPMPPHIVQPFTDRNEHTLDSLGGELVMDYQPWKWWRFVGSYSYLDAELYQNGSADPGVFTDEDRRSPQNQFIARSLVDLPYDLQFDSVLRFVDNTVVSSDYWELDLRLGWSPTKNLDFSVVGQNLLHDSHDEWIESRFGQGPVAISRGVYGRVTYKFS